MGEELQDSARSLELTFPLDLRKTIAPVWWGRGRWPNVDWRDSVLYWVGWEGQTLVWRSVAQMGSSSLRISGSADPLLDRDWASRVLAFDHDRPIFTDPVLRWLATEHGAMGMWSAGSLYEGFVSSIVGQSISVASAAVTEQRLYALFHPGLLLAGRTFWPPPRSEQLAVAEPGATSASGITRVRAAALREVGEFFATSDQDAPVRSGERARRAAEALLRIRGVGRWTIESALLWGVGDPDAHPSGDVALLRAARIHFADVETLKDLDRKSEEWRPYRAWAARHLWLDLLRWPEGE